MIVSFHRALPWTLKDKVGPEPARRQALPHETVGVNPTEVQLVEPAASWTDEAGGYWCSSITLRRQSKDALPLIVVGKVEDVITRLNLTEERGVARL